MDIGSLLQTENRTQLERWCEQRAKTVYLGKHRLLCRVLGDQFMMVDGRDLSLTPHLAMSGYWEMWITQFLARVVKPGMHCIDVGANFGYFSVLMGALVGPTGWVQAWEPNPGLEPLLNATIALNGLRHVELVPFAASEGEKSCPLFVPGNLWGSASLSAVEMTGAESPVGVKTQRLDHPDFAIDEYGRVDVIKIDAEGHEPEVWAGASGVIDRNPHVGVLMEFAPDRYADAPGFLQTITEAGFKLHIVGTDGEAKAATEAQILAPKQGFEMVWLKRADR